MPEPRSGIRGKVYEAARVADSTFTATQVDIIMSS